MAGDNWLSAATSFTIFLQAYNYMFHVVNVITYLICFVDSSVNYSYYSSHLAQNNMPQNILGETSWDEMSLARNVAVPVFL